jgi:hypothetical protein
MKIPYGEVLSRAWKITWKNKILWIFGFLAALAGEFGSSGSNGMNIFNRLIQTGRTGGTEYLPPELQNVVDWFSRLEWNTLLTYIAAAVGCFCLCGIVLFILSNIGLGGLLKGILRADAGETVTFREAWAHGRRYFWRLTGISLVDGAIRLLIGVSAFLIIFLPMLIVLFGEARLASVTTAVIFMFLLMCPVYCCMFVFVPLLNFYIYFTKLAVVEEDLSFAASFQRAYGVIKTGLLPLIIIGLIVWAITLGVSFIAMIITAPFFGLLLAAIWPAIAETGPINMPLLYGAGALFLLSLPISWLMSGVWTAWANSVYALVYKQLALSPTQNPAA